MAGEDRSQATGLVERGLKRKNADHEIQPAGHLGYAAFIPCPYLRADVIQDAAGVTLGAERFREAEIESRVVHQHNGIGIFPPDRSEHRVEFLSEIAVMPQHIPEADNGGALHPVIKTRVAQGLHSRPSSSTEADIRVLLPHRIHDLDRPRVAALLARHKPKIGRSHRHGAQGWCGWLGIKEK